MNQYGGRPFRQPAAAGVVESVALPIDGLESLCQQASALLVHQRDSVGEAQNIDRPLRLQVSSEDQSDLDLEGVALAFRAMPSRTSSVGSFSAHVSMPSGRPVASRESA